MKTLKYSKRMVAIAIVLFVGLFASVFVVGEVLSHHARRDIGDKPTDLPYESVCIVEEEKQVISGWQLPGHPDFGVVLLLHGVRADRREMLGRAKFLNRIGYSVVLIDLPAHGQSSGERITYGLKEAEGVKSALNYIKEEFPGKKTAVIGVSLGAASFVLSKQGSMVSAVVLESMFPSIEDAVKDRLNLYLGSDGELLSPLLLWQLPLRINISPNQLRPIAEIPALNTPVLIMAGDLDKHTPLAETKSIYAAANNPKELLIFEGAAHVDLYSFAPKIYENRVEKFLYNYLR